MIKPLINYVHQCLLKLNSQNHMKLNKIMINSKWITLLRSFIKNFVIDMFMQDLVLIHLVIFVFQHG